MHINITMAAYGDQCFIKCLQKPPLERTPKDLDTIYSHLHGMEALSSLREPALRSLCRSVRYEHHDANDILYCQGELNNCWYILLSGSVFIDGSMFLPRSSFGKRSVGCSRRTSECLILEPSEMIVIDYPDVHGLKAGHRQPNSNMVDRLLLQHDSVPILMSNSDNEHMSIDLQVPGLYNRGDPYLKRNSRASDTSSAYSGSDMMQSSIDDQENDLSGFVESAVDSDDEEGYADSNESFPVRDAIRDCLEKEPGERTEDDIEILLEFMQLFRAFTNMTLPIRRALCSVMVFAMVEEAGQLVMKDGEEQDSWCVILNGRVQINRPDGSVETLQMGDCFGITPTIDKVYHVGEMKTIVEDCQFVCIAQSDYYRILHQGEENTRRHEEKGEVVMITEHRILDGGNRKGHIVIRGTPDRLIHHLIEDHASVDPTYVEDFLLTFRHFLSNPLLLGNKFLSWFEDQELRAKVIRIVLLWVNNHFNDYETNSSMTEFLEKFEQLLERNRLTGQLRLLNIACAAKARTRNVTLTRATREEILHFSVLGGQERSCGIFISKVETGSKAYEAGLKRGDQILEVNGQNFQSVSHNQALEALRGTTHLSITVKSNLSEFKEMIVTPVLQCRKPKKEDIARLQPDPKQRLSAPDLESVVPPVITLNKDKKEKKDKTGFMTIGNRPKLKKALMKINFLPKNHSDSSINHSDENLQSRNSRKSSTSSNSSSTAGMSNHLSASNPDLSTSGLGFEDPKLDYPENVLKVYRLDQAFKFLPVHKETAARQVVMLALREFGSHEPSSNYSLCEVTVQGDVIKQKRLPDTLADLPERLSLNGRYYLKNNMSTEKLVPDELWGEFSKEGDISLLNIITSEVASQLTLADFKIFRDIEPTEYVDNLFSLNSAYGTPNLQKFEEISNREVYWVVTEICSEANAVKRMKLIKHFIKIAKHCKDCKNFNSMFAILSGLGNPCVERLRSTWDKLPGKYNKIYEDLQELMKPDRNFSNYRTFINSDRVEPPLLPFFPVVKRDMTFIHLGNDSFVNGLVNFEKLRMVAKEVRQICNMCSTRYDVNTMFLGTSSLYSSSIVSGVATLKRSKVRRSYGIPNPKKMYEEAQMVRRVKSYLQNMPVISDEDKLTELSYACEPPVRRKDTSPNISLVSNSISSEDKKSIHVGPKFGAESPDAVRKLMALSNKSKPHNSKHTLPHAISPISTRRPHSPRQGRLQRVHLSPESSSVVSLTNMIRKPSRTGSVASSESASPTSSVSSHQMQYETDSSHNSISSSNFDSHSTSSVGSANSPPFSRRGNHVPQTAPHNSHPALPLLPPAQARPPLPPYHVVMQHSPAAYSNYIHQAYTNMRRPPLPDYQIAAHMAHLSRQKQLRELKRAQSHEGAYGQSYRDIEEPVNVDDEQVSAV